MVNTRDLVDIEAAGRFLGGFVICVVGDIAGGQCLEIDAMVRVAEPAVAELLDEKRDPS